MTEEKLPAKGGSAYGGKKSGIVAFIGRSNVGKSTLLNAIIGTKISITSPKPQTTRTNVQGVLHEERGQIVFVDTPGIFLDVDDLLTKNLNEKARETASGIDLVLYVVDANRHVGTEEHAVRTIIKNSKIPTILVFNKSELAQEYKNEYLAWVEDFIGTIEVSAETGKGLKQLINLIFDNLTENEPLYPQNQLTNIDNKFWVAELIREKIFLKMRDEVPYTITVEVTEDDVRANGVRYIHANIITIDERYKKMMIGEGGRNLKYIGTKTREELEAVTNQKVFIDLHVAVDPHWQEKMV